MVSLNKRNFKYFNCPVCGKTLINLEQGHEEKGLHRFWCDVDNIDYSIDENKSDCDDVEE